MIYRVRGGLVGLGLVCAFTLLLVASAKTQQLPQGTTERIESPSRVTTEQLRGTVAYFAEDNLVVRMADGEFREFQVPATAKFRIDGKEVPMGELKPGTRLTATVTTTTPIAERTTTLVSGKVWWISGNAIIITLPDNENKLYTVNSDTNFIADGKKASIHTLRRGMQITAEKVVESPHTEIALETVVTGYRK